MIELSETIAPQINKPQNIYETSLYYGRPSDFYFLLLNIAKEDLEGQTVLNVGAGATDLKTDLQRDSVHANVINLDIQYSTSRPKGSSNRQLVAGDKLNLPIQSSSVDYALGLHLGGYNTNETEAKALSEMVRVARKKAVFYPWDGDSEGLKKFVKENGLGDGILIDSPNRRYLKMFSANMRHQQTIPDKINRGLNNTLLAYTELFGHVFRSKRVTVDIQKLNRHHDGAQLLHEFLGTYSSTQNEAK